ncbi:MAG: hypothetical protein QNJ29_06195 [Rhizobiaceae bacterium]|nr:hypothetical protein [Rhizobiaceae bacterium]
MHPPIHKITSTIQPYGFRHTLIIGQGGSGKSNLCNQLVQSDIEQDAGLFHVDLDGTDTDTILSTVPKRRIRDVVLLDLADTDFPVAVNPFVGTGNNYDATIADMFVDAFKSIWGYEDATTPDMDRTIYNAARATLDFPGGTILDMYQMLVSEQTRKKITASVKDEIIRAYWREHFANLDHREQNVITKSTINKLERFVSDVRIRNILGQSKPMFDFNRAMNERKIILLKIPQSEFGLSKSRTIASLMLAQLNAIAQRRRGIPPFHLYLPDCQHLIGQTMAHMLGTLGKRNVSITLSIQHLHQLGKLREAVFGSVGNWIMFRVGLTDALYLEELFEWDNTRKFLYELAPFETRIMTPHGKPINQVTTKLYPNSRNYKNRIV